MMVLAVFPAFMLPVTAIKSVILFQRGKKTDIQVQIVPLMPIVVAA